MWLILEHRTISKVVRKLPPGILEKYDIWKDLVYRGGPECLREFPGYHDERLRGNREGQRSSRLSLHYRIIYSVDRNIVTVYVLEITPHRY
ncbi:MAG: type II toxin-antitoxin system mRNA interferase toxin, RelE/StbE family [Elusimicrobia bacterium]|nr:type II toxin-antitoxin system mRNA interferase toxin, RelE/StbE family [Elusimicrobiota bacterium]